MRAFITLCILATACAKPQGYSYQSQQNSYQNHQNSFQASSVSSAQHHHSNSIASIAPSFLQEALKNAKVSQSLIGAPTTNYIPPATGSSFPHTASHQQGFQPSSGPLQPPTYNSYAPQHQYQQQGSYAQSPALVTKDIYVHVAPEEREEPQYQRPVLPPPPPRKHYRIVFIKAPTPKIQKAAVHVNQAPTEEKTIIYVLTRKPDPIDLEAAYQEAAPKQPSKPEVYFIKYRTQEEAQHAQRTIQAQYDQLGGTTQVTDEGVAPVTSVIGSLDQQHGKVEGNIGHSAGVLKNSISSSSSSGTFSSGSFSSGNSNSVSGDNSQYLPPIRI